jgi:hypothetical protein
VVGGQKKKGALAQNRRIGFCFIGFSQIMVWAKALLFFFAILPAVKTAGY